MQRKMTSKRVNNSYKRYCCVYGCLNRRKNNESILTFFKIPDDIERRQEWLKAIDREDLLDEKKLNKAKNNFICSVHFDDSAIISSISKRLKNDAVPKKLLPHECHKNNQPDACDLIVTIKDTSIQVLPQTTKDISSHLSKKYNILKSTNNHIQTQTDTRAQKHTLQYEKKIERGIAKPNIDKSLNEFKHKSTVPSEPTTSTSQSQTKVTSTSTQTDLYETLNKMTQTTSALSNKSPRKRKLQ